MRQRIWCRRASRLFLVGLAVGMVTLPLSGLVSATMSPGRHTPTSSYPSKGDFAIGQNGALVLGHSQFTLNSANTPGCSANTLHPGVAVSDGSGNLWVADISNHRVLKYPTPFSTGMYASLVLGQADFNASSGNRGGSVAANTLYNPNGIAFDASGDLWVADHSNSRVLKYAAPFSSGMAATLVLGQADFASGSPNRGGSAAANTLSVPSGLVFDASGNLWIADSGNNRVLKYTAPLSSGMAATLVLGQADFATGSANRGGAVAANTLSFPQGLALDGSGDPWVSDHSNHRVLKYAAPLSNGMAATLVVGQSNFTSGSGNRGNVAGAATLAGPYGIAFDGQGHLWAADIYNHRVLRYAAPLNTGMDATLVLGQPDFTSGSPNRGGPAAANTLSNPRGVVVDGSGNLWATSFGRVARYATPFSSGMDASLVLGQENFKSDSPNRAGTVAANTLWMPFGSAFDAAGNLWVTDVANNRVLKYAAPFSSGMAATLVLGQADFITGSANRGGTVAANTLYNPNGIAFDAMGNLWVADVADNRVLKYAAPFSTGMAASLVLGQADFNAISANRGGSVAAANTLSNPRGVAVDGSGNLWVADSGNNRVLKYLCSGYPGDANGDSLLNAVDITSVERIIAGLDPQTPGADANGDGLLNAVDITKVERLVAGLD